MVPGVAQYYMLESTFWVLQTRIWRRREKEKHKTLTELLALLPFLLTVIKQDGVPNARTYRAGIVDPFSFLFGCPVRSRRYLNSYKTNPNGR